QLSSGARNEARRAGVAGAAGYDLLFDLCSAEAESRKWLTIIRLVSMLKGKRRAVGHVRVVAGRSFRQTGRSTKPRRILTAPFPFGSANVVVTRNSTNERNPPEKRDTD